MNKKFLILLLIPFLLCGCKANYTIEIDESSIKEETYIYSDDSDEYNNQIYRGTVLKDYFKALPSLEQSAFINTTGEDVSSSDDKDNNDFGLGTYTIKYINKTNEKGSTFTYRFNKDEYQNSYIPNMNATTFKCTNSNNEIKLRLKDMYAFTSYKLLEEVKVLVKVSDYYEVTSHNAEIVNGNEYMWVVTRDNYIDNDLRINLKVKENKNDASNTKPSDKKDDNIKDSDNNKKETNYTMILVYILLATLVVVGIFLILFQKKSNNNKI